MGSNFVFRFSKTLKELSDLSILDLFFFLASFLLPHTQVFPDDLGVDDEFWK